jgi:hypothetical protein
MRYWFYPLYVVVMGVIIFVLDVLLGHLYVRYMVFLTGTLFMIGMLVGEGIEQRLAKRQKASENPRPISAEDKRTPARPSRIEPLSRPSAWVGGGGLRPAPKTLHPVRGPALVDGRTGPVSEVDR